MNPTPENQLIAAPVTIRSERPGDETAIREIHHRAFDRVDEAALVDRLREEGQVVLSLVALVDDQIVGHVLFCPVTIHTAQGPVPALALAPLAVLPQWQSMGIGAQLVRDGLLDVTNLGHRIVTVLGEPAFYGRCGFSCAAARGLAVPFDRDHWMAMELVPGSLEGVRGRVEYPEAFGIALAEAED